MYPSIKFLSIWTTLNLGTKFPQNYMNHKFFKKLIAAKDIYPWI